MPYIKADDRPRLDAGGVPQTPGELNYLISTRIKKLVDEKGKSYALFNDIIVDLEDAKEAVAEMVRLDEFAGEIADLAFKYIFQIGELSEKDMKVRGVEAEVAIRRMNSARGAIECAKLEFYARVVRPYEETKIVENGDVYD